MKSALSSDICSNTGWCEFVHLFVYFNNNPCFISPRTHVVNERKNAKVRENDSLRIRPVV